MFNTPPQAGAYIIWTKLVTYVLNTRTFEVSSKHVCKLVTGVDKVNDDFSWEHLFSHKVTVNFYLFSLLMEDRIWCNVESNLIVA